MHIINCTPHDVNIVTPLGDVIRTIQPSGVVARCDNFRNKITEIEGIPIYRNYYANVNNLPDPIDDTMYIVSSILGQNAIWRDDILVPGKLVKNKHGKVIGCQCLDIP